MNATQGSYHVAQFATHLQSEIRRLDAQVDLFWGSEKSLLTRHGLRDGMAVLDCGCGPGRLLELLCSEFTGMSLAGLEIDPILVDVCRQRFPGEGEQGILVQQGSAEDPGFPPNSFDFITMRLVLEHVPDPVKALESLRALLKPGGRIAIISNDFEFHLRSWPDVAELDPLYVAYCASRRQDGGDPCLGRRLPALLSKAGFDVEGFEIEVSHSQLVGDNAFFQAEGVGIPAQLVESGFLDQQVFEDMIHAWKQMLRHPDHCIMRPLFVGIGRRPHESEDVHAGASPQQDALAHNGSKATQRAPDINYVSPSTELEKQLAGLWRDAMKLEDVGVRSNFFDLGGDSLMLEELQSQMAERFDLHLPMAVLFQYPTIEQLAAHLEQQSNHQRHGELSAESRANSAIDVNRSPEQEAPGAAQEDLGTKAERRRAALSNKKNRRADRS